VTKLLSALNTLKEKAVVVVGKKQEKVVELEKKNTVLEAKVKRLSESLEVERRASFEAKEVEDAFQRTHNLHDKLGSAIDQVATYGNQLGEIVAHLEATSPSYKSDKSSKRKNANIFDQQLKEKVLELVQSPSLKLVEQNIKEELTVEILNGQLELIQLKLREANLESKKQSEQFRKEKTNLVAEVKQLETKVIELRAMVEEKTEIADEAHEKLAALSKQQDEIIREHTKMIQEKLDATIALSSVHKKRVDEMTGELLEVKTKMLAMGDSLEQVIPLSPFTTDQDTRNDILEKRLLLEKNEFENEMLCDRQVVSLQLKNKEVNTGDLEKWLLSQKQDLEIEQLSFEEKISRYCEPDATRPRPPFENSRKSVEETRLDALNVILVAEKELLKSDLQTKQGRSRLLESAIPS